MACRVIKNDQGRVIEVYQENGTPSVLFTQISEVLPDADLAYATYHRAMIDSQSNIEPTFESVLPYVQAARNNSIEYKKVLLEADVQNKETALIENLDNFLRSINVNVSIVNNLVDTTTDKPISIAARARLGQKLIEIAQDRATLKDFAEEGAHFLVEILRETQAPLYTGMEQLVTSYQIYKDMMKEDNFYYQKYKGDQDLIKREAMAKIIALNLLNKNLDSQHVDTSFQESPEKLSRLERWGKRLVAWIKKLWGSVSGNAFVQSSQLILNNSLDEYLAAQGLLSAKETAGNVVLPNLEMPSVGQPNTDTKTKDIVTRLDKYDVYELKDDIPVGEKKYWKLLTDQSDLYIQRYVHKDDASKILEVRMTDAAQLLYLQKQKGRKLPYQSKEEKKFWEEVMAKRAATGTAGHNTLEALLRYHTKDKNIKSDETTLLQIQQKYGFNDVHFRLLNANLKALLKHTANIQKQIDPEQSPIYRPEQFVINKTEDAGGTIDLLVIYSNGTASIYDYKFSTPSKMHLHWRNKQRVLKSDPWADKTEQYDVQISGYKQALLDKYGITDVIESRIIPVAVYYEVVKGKPTSRVVSMKMGGHFLSELYTAEEKKILKEDPDAGFLEPIPVAGEKTGIESIDRLITKERDRLAILIKEKGDANFQKKQVLTKRIGFSRNILKRLALKKNVDSAIIEAFRVRKRAEEGLASNNQNEKNEDGSVNTKYMKDDELQQVYLDLKHFEGFLKLQDLMDHYGKIQKSEEDAGRKNEELWKEMEKEKENIKKLLSDVGVLQLTLEAIENKIVERAQDYVKKLGMDPQSITNYNTSITGIGKLMIPLSAQTNPYMRAIYLTKRDINSKITQVTKELAAEIEDIQNAVIEEFGHTGVQIYDKLINPYTMNFYSRWDESWREQKEQALETGNVSWIKEHFEINPAFFEKKGKFNFHTMKADMEKIVRETMQSNQDGSFTQNQKKELERLLSRWDVKSFDAAWLNPKNLTGRFGLKLKAGVKQKFKSKEQIEIEKSPALSRFREFHEKMAWKFANMMGIDVHAGYIADVQKDLFASMMEDGFNINQITQAVTDLFQVRQHEQGFGFLDENGEFMRQIPRLHTVQLFNKDGSPDNSLKSKELGKSLYLLGKAAYQYKYNMEVLPQLSLLKRMLTDKFPAAQELQTDVFGKLVIDSTGEVRKKVQSANAETITDVIDQEIYGRSLKTQDVVTPGRVSRNKTILSLKSYHSLTTLGLSVPVALGAFGAGMVNTFTQSSKGIHYTTKQLLSAQKSLLSMDPKIQAIFEFFELSLIDEIHRRGDMLSTNFRTKYMQTDRFFEFLARADKTIDAVLAVAMAKNHGIHPETGELKRIKELPEGTKSIYESIDAVQDPKWKMGSVRNKYQVNLKGFQKEKAKENITQKELEALQEKNNRALNAWGTFQARVQRISSKVKGTMNVNDKALFNQHLIGRLMMHYRTWLPALAHERFASLRYDHVMDHYDEGTWRSLFRNVGKDKTFDSIKQAIDTEVSYLSLATEIGKDILKIGVDVGTFGLAKWDLKEGKAKLQFEEFLNQHIGDPQYMKGNRLLNESDPEYTAEFEKFIELKRANLRAGLAELRAVLLLMLTLMGLGGDWDEDGDIDIRESWSGRKLHNIMNRVYRETAFFLDLRELTGPRASGLPLISLGSQLIQFSSNSVDELLDAVTGRDDKDDKYNGGYYGFKFIPGNKLIRPLEPFAADKHSRTD